MLFDKDQKSLWKNLQTKYITKEDSINLLKSYFSGSKLEFTVKVENYFYSELVRLERLKFKKNEGLQVSDAENMLRDYQKTSSTAALPIHSDNESYNLKTASRDLSLSKKVQNTQDSMKDIKKMLFKDLEEAPLKQDLNNSEIIPFDIECFENSDVISSSKKLISNDYSVTGNLNSEKKKFQEEEAKKLPTPRLKSSNKVTEICKTPINDKNLKNDDLSLELSFTDPKAPEEKTSNQKPESQRKKRRASKSPVAWTSPNIITKDKSLKNVLEVKKISKSVSADLGNSKMLIKSLLNSPKENGLNKRNSTPINKKIEKINISIKEASKPYDKEFSKKNGLPETESNRKSEDCKEADLNSDFSRVSKNKPSVYRSPWVIKKTDLSSLKDQSTILGFNKTKKEAPFEEKNIFNHLPKNNDIILEDMMTTNDPKTFALFFFQKFNKEKLKISLFENFQKIKNKIFDLLESSEIAYIPNISNLFTGCYLMSYKELKLLDLEYFFAEIVKYLGIKRIKQILKIILNPSFPEENINQQFETIIEESESKWDSPEIKEQKLHSIEEQNPHSTYLIREERPFSFDVSEAIPIINKKEKVKINKEVEHKKPKVNIIPLEELEPSSINEYNIWDRINEAIQLCKSNHSSQQQEALPIYFSKDGSQAFWAEKNELNNPEPTICSMKKSSWLQVHKKSNVMPVVDEPKATDFPEMKDKSVLRNSQYKQESTITNYYELPIPFQVQASSNATPKLSHTYEGSQNNISFQRTEKRGKEAFESSETFENPRDEEDFYKTLKRRSINQIKARSTVSGDDGQKKDFGEVNESLKALTNFNSNSSCEKLTEVLNNGFKLKNLEKEQKRKNIRQTIIEFLIHSGISPKNLKAKLDSARIIIRK